MFFCVVYNETNKTHIMKINKYLKTRRRRAKPFKQKYSSAKNIIIKLGIATLFIYIVLAIILVNIEI